MDTFLFFHSSCASVSGSEVSYMVAPSYRLFMQLPGNTGMVRTSVVKFFPVPGYPISDPVSILRQCPNTSFTYLCEE